MDESEQDRKPLQEDFLEVRYSFGWQSWLGTNICLLDERNVCFGAGTYIIIMDMFSGNQNILPTICYTGVAHIIVHPSCSMFAVAEKGSKATIDVFTYPELELSKLLKGGAECSYVCIDFNADGKLLASLAAKPDFTLTVWQWETETIILKTKAFSVDIWKVAFSKFVCGRLITVGRGHIKFWTMAKTFTGLKLKGVVGKFGHTEICDIHSFAQLSDGKVISSSQCGNMLLWDDSKIQTQISGSGGTPCHDGIIHHISMEEGELYTVGSDGWVRVWDAESVEMLFPDEEQGTYMLKPLGEVYTQNADLRCLTRPPNAADKKLWYAQDAKGIIWKMDMSLDLVNRPPEAMIMFPGVKITGCEISPLHNILAISSKDCCVRLYNCFDNSLITSRKYDFPVTSLLWGSRLLDRDGASLFLGFENGVVRWVVIKQGKTDNHELLLHKALKLHDFEVTCIKINTFVTHVISCGLDGKVFFCFIRKGDMQPVGYVDVGHPLEWMMYLSKIDLIVVGGNGSFIAAVEITRNTAATRKKDLITYKLADVTYRSIKLNNRVRASTLLDAEEQDSSYPEIIAKKDGENTTDCQIGETEMDKNDEEPNNVTCALYTGIAGIFWLCLETEEPEFIYEYELTRNMMSKKVINLYLTRKLQLASVSQPQLITSMQFMSHEYYLVTGQTDGIVTAYALGKTKPAKLKELWSQRIMDCEVGTITFLSTSYDGRFLAAVSSDNNALMFKINAPKYASSESFPETLAVPSSHYATLVHDISAEEPSLEAACKAALEVQRKHSFEKRRQQMINEMTLYRSKFAELSDLNVELPTHMQIDLEQYAVHDRIKSTLKAQREGAVQKAKRRLEYDIEYNELLLKKIEEKYKNMISQELFFLTSFLSREATQSYRMVNFPVEHYRSVDFSEFEQLKVLELESLQKPRESQTAGMSLCGPQDPIQVAGERDDEELRKILEKYIGDHKLKTSFDYNPPNYVVMEPKLKKLQILQLALQRYEKREKMNQTFLEIKTKNQIILNKLSGLNGFTEIDNSESIILNKEARKKLLQLQTSMDSHKCDKFDSVCPWHIGTTLYPSEETLKEVPERAGAASAHYSWKIFSKFVGLVRRASMKGTGKYLLFKKKPWEYAADMSRKLNSIKNIKENYIKDDMYFQTLKELWRFDFQLHLYNLNKRYLDTQTKQAQMKGLIFMQEYEIYLRYDNQRKRLNNQSCDKHNQMALLEKKLKEQQEIIKQQDAFLLSLTTEEANINARFLKLLGQNNKQEKLLTKFFRKKISPTSIEAGGGETEALEELEEEDDSDWSSEDDDFYTEWDFKECPAGCDPELFESICSLRRQRSFVDHKIKEVKHLKQIHIKEVDIVENRSKELTESLVPIQQQLESIRVLKQNELNNIYHTVHLNLHQVIHCKSPVPQDLNDCVIFWKKEADFLQERLNALTKDAGESTKVSKDDQLKKVELKGECRILVKRTQELKEILKERMMEKFGCMVDLEELRLVENPIGIKNLEVKQREQFLDHQKAMRQRKEKIVEKERKFAELRKVRSINVQTLTALKAEWLALHNSLSKRKPFTFLPKPS